MSFNYFEHIDDYLLDRLNSVDKEIFENELAHNKELSKATRETKELMDFVHKVEDKKIYDRILVVEDERRSHARLKRTNRKRRNIILLLGAAAVVLLIIRVKFGDFDKRRLSPQEIYTQYYTAPEISFNSREGRSDFENLEKASNLYLSEKYEEALIIFLAEELLNDDSKIRFAIASCFNELGEEDKALKKYDELIQSKDILYADPARWYSGLIYLEIDQAEKAKEVLTPFLRDSTENHRYRERVKSLLTHLH